MVFMQFNHFWERLNECDLSDLELSLCHDTLIGAKRLDHCCLVGLLYLPRESALGSPGWSSTHACLLLDLNDVLSCRVNAINMALRGVISLAFRHFGLNQLAVHVGLVLDSYVPGLRFHPHRHFFVGHFDGFDLS